MWYVFSYSSYCPLGWPRPLPRPLPRPGPPDRFIGFFAGSDFSAQSKWTHIYCIACYHTTTDTQTYKQASARASTGQCTRQYRLQNSTTQKLPIHLTVDVEDNGLNGLPGTYKRRWTVVDDTGTTPVATLVTCSRG